MQAKMCPWLKIKTIVVLDAMPHSLVDRYQHLGGIHLLLPDYRGSTFIEVLVNIYQTAWCYIP